MALFFHTLFLLLVARSLLEGMLQTMHQQLLRAERIRSRGGHSIQCPEWMAVTGYSMVSAGAVYVLTDFMVLLAITEFLFIWFQTYSRFKGLSANSAVALLIFVSVLQAALTAIADMR